MQVTPEEIPAVARLVDELCGVVLDETKGYLIDSRLGSVAIYFKTEVKRDLFNRLADRLTPDGYLFVGSSESLANLDPRFVPQSHCRSVFYQPNKQSAMAMA